MKKISAICAVQLQSYSSRWFYYCTLVKTKFLMKSNNIQFYPSFTKKGKKNCIYIPDMYRINLTNIYVRKIISSLVWGKIIL